MPAARHVEAAERAGEALHVRQNVLFRHEGILEHDLAGDRGAQRKLALDLRRGETLGAALDQESADDAVELRPHHRDVGDRRVADPHLGAVELEAARHLLRAGHHRAGIGAVVGLGEAEAADHLARGELGQICLALRLAAVGIDRMHYQRGLHRHGRAIAGIDALDLAGDQAIGDIAEAGAAVLFRDRGAEQAERAHLGDDRAVEALLAVIEEHAREQFVLRIAARGVAHHALLFRQLAFQIERILPVERGVLELRGRPLLALLGGLRHGMLPGEWSNFAFNAHVHPRDSRGLLGRGQTLSACCSRTLLRRVPADSFGKAGIRDERSRSYLARRQTHRRAGQHPVRVLVGGQRPELFPPNDAAQAGHRRPRRRSSGRNTAATKACGASCARSTAAAYRRRSSAAGARASSIPT